MIFVKGLFGYDGVLINFFGKIADLVCLSVLWLLCSLPIFTMGAATAAMYNAVYKSMRQGLGGIWSNYWEGFRANFKQATLVWLILMAMYAVLGASAYSAYQLLELEILGVMPLILVAIVAAVVTMWAVYLLPSVARFTAPTRQILKSCAAVALINLFWSAALLAVLVVGGYLTFTVPVGLMVVPGAAMYVSSMILEHILPKYAEPQEKAEEEQEASGEA